MQALKTSGMTSTHLEDSTQLFADLLNSVESCANTHIGVARASTRK